MKLTDMMKISDSYTDETVTQTNALNYANKGIALINTSCGTVLPFITNASTDYTALNESWVYRLFISYMNYSVKLNDSSLNEANTYRIEFEVALADFSSKFLDVLDEAYTGGQLGYYLMDTSEAIDSAFWNGSRGGGL